MAIRNHLARETAREYALRVFKNRIINLDLAPGSLISEAELSEEMGLSRTPIREALIELSKTQVVTVYPQKGWRVALVDYDTVEECRFIRYVLEMSVVEQVCRVAQEEDLLRLSKNVKLQTYYLENNESNKLLEQDDAFHRSLFDIANKQMAYQLMHSAQIHFDRVRMMALSAVKNTKIVQDHQMILDAIVRRDAPGAQAQMDKHLSRFRIDEQALRARYPDYFAEDVAGQSFDLPASS